MNLYNKWFMRASGEAKHQAKTPAEKCSFAIFDYLAKHNRKEHWSSLDEDELSLMMDNINTNLMDTSDDHGRPNPDKSGLMIADFLRKKDVLAIDGLKAATDIAGIIRRVIS